MLPILLPVLVFIGVISSCKLMERYASPPTMEKIFKVLFIVFTLTAFGCLCWFLATFSYNTCGSIWWC